MSSEQNQENVEKKLIDNGSLGIIGAGLVGLAMGILFAKDGIKVEIFERRKEVFTSHGRRSNLLLGYRGKKMLMDIGINPQKDQMFTGFHGLFIHKYPEEKKDIKWAAEMHTVDRQELYDEMLRLAQQEPNLKLNFGHTYKEIHMQDAILEFEDYKQQFIWLLGCDGLNSPIREKMMETGLFKYERIENGFSFIETRVRVPPGTIAERQHLAFNKECQLMLTPLREGYKKDPVEMQGFLGLRREKIRDMTQADIREVVKALNPELEGCLEFLDKDEIKVNDFITIVHCSPWSYGKVTLMGDSCHTQGPEGAIGLNLNWEMGRGFRDLVREFNGDFAKSSALFEERFEAQSLAATQVQQIKRRAILIEGEEAKETAAVQGTLAYLARTYPDKFLAMDDLVQFSSIKHQKIFEYMAIAQQVVKYARELKPVPMLFGAGRLTEIDAMLDKHQEYINPLRENLNQACKEMDSWK